MNLNRFFDGGYVDEDGQLVLKITTLHNPAGFVIKAERTGSSLTIDIDKAIEPLKGVVGPNWGAI